ncbi:glycosyltransferase family 4 protein [Micromonospora sp. NPDC092111]|uniref:glycosyltransferase family 4 protein n=1 Tax=Micromonospora sp. NPDC092111 TaxID=3364289 RepID=UPI0038188375
MRVLTGIDLPYGTPGGSVELLRDLYLGERPLVPSDAFMLAPADPTVAVPEAAPFILVVDGKTLDAPGFWTYTEKLSVAVRERFDPAHVDVMHLQHLAFGATPALQRAFPELPQIAVVHGTDLLFAESHPTQAEVLRSTARTADAVVVPTLAMVDRLAALDASPRGPVVHIPWGVPDELLAAEAGEQRDRSGPLRVLYAGRLTAEKTTPSILAVLAGLDGVQLSVAAPPGEYARLAGSHDLGRVDYLGWKTRPALWREFRRHDLLIVPSLRLEAFGLAAIEAQACGLPVAFHAVPGLREVLADSALAVDFTVTADVVAMVERVRRDPAVLDELRARGRANSARFPLSATATALRSLSAEVARA